MEMRLANKKITVLIFISEPGWESYIPKHSYIGDVLRDSLKHSSYEFCSGTGKYICPCIGNVYSVKDMWCHLNVTAV